MTIQAASETWRQRTDLAHSKTRALSRQLVLAELLRCGEEIPPAAAEAMADRWAPMFDRARPEIIADYIRRHLSDSDVVCLSRADGRQADETIVQTDMNHLAGGPRLGGATDRVVRY